MASPTNRGMIDGFMSVQAIRHKNDRISDDKKSDATLASSDDTQKVAAQSDATERKKVAIGRTAMPTRHELVCYSCGYQFVVNGRLDKVFCPKCREQLETGDHLIEGEWTRDILTVGKVHIKSGAILKGANIVATDIVVGGNCSDGKLTPSRHIELETGAVVPPEVLNNRRIIIRAHSKIVLEVPLRCTDLDIHGDLHAKVIPSGKVTIYPSGMLRGELIGEHLTVMEGAGLSAFLKIMPAPKNASTQKTTKRENSRQTKTEQKVTTDKKGKQPPQSKPLPSSQKKPTAPYKGNRPSTGSPSSRIPFSLQ